jgi:hypothetical protein
MLAHFIEARMSRNFTLSRRGAPLYRLAKQWSLMLVRRLLLSVGSLARITTACLPRRRFAKKTTQ